MSEWKKNHLVNFTSKVAKMEVTGQKDKLELVKEIIDSYKVITAGRDFGKDAGRWALQTFELDMTRKPSKKKFRQRRRNS